MAEMTLLASHFDRDLTAEEHAELEAWLNQSPEHVHDFVAWSVMETAIEELYEAELGGKPQEDTQAWYESLANELYDVEQTESNSLSFKNAMSLLVYACVEAAKAKPFKQFAAVAAMFLVALIAWQVWSPQGPEQEDGQLPLIGDVQPDTQSNPSSTLVATLTAERDAVWDRRPGQDLSAGDRLTLTQGFAEITTARGAVAILEAPATIELLDHNALRLLTGKLVGICETESSKGFVVKTVHADIVDLGTRFGVEVTPASTTALVMEGTVYARPAAGASDTFDPVVLKRSDAVRIAAGTNRLEQLAVEDAPVFSTGLWSDYELAVKKAGPALWLRQNEQDPARLMGSASYGAAAATGFGVLNLDGRGCVDAGDVLDFEADQPFSIAAWVRTGQNPDHMFVAGRIARNQQRALYGYDVYLRDGRPRFQLNHNYMSDTDGSLIRVETNQTISEAAWHYLVCTYDGSRRASGIKIYIDGVAAPLNVIDDSLGDQTIRVDTTFRVGIRGHAQPIEEVDLQEQSRDIAFSGGKPLIGAVGDTLVFGRVLNEEEVQSFFTLSRDAYASRGAKAIDEYRVGKPQQRVLLSAKSSPQYFTPTGGKP